MSLTRNLVGIIRRKEASQEDLERAALFVLDTLACALGALGTGPAHMLKAVATPETADAARRAFYVGGLCHILELDDLHRDSVTHPGSVVIPAAWALAEERNTPGRDFLKAVLAGYEACTRVGMAVGPAHYRIWHNTATCGPFGSAAAAAEIIGLGEDQCVWALGNAGTQSSGLWQFLETGAMSKHLHTARAAEAGVLAALLAQEGFTGAERILEGEKGFFAGLCPDPTPEAVVADYGGGWQLASTSIKPWPCCRHTHPAIDAAIELHRRLAGAKVRSARIGAYQAALDVCDRPLPHDPYSARFSLQHCVAAALAEGAVDQSSFDAKTRDKVAPLRSRMAVALSPEIDGAYPRAWGVEIDVETEDGRSIRAVRRHAKGDPENPVSAEEISLKARGLLEQGGLSAAEAKRFIAATLGLARKGTVRDLDLLAHAAAAAPEGAARERVRHA